LRFLKNLSDDSNFEIFRDNMTDQKQNGKIDRPYKERQTQSKKMFMS